MANPAHLKDKKRFDLKELPPNFLPVAIVCIICAIVYLVVYINFIDPSTDSPSDDSYDASLELEVESEEDAQKWIEATPVKVRGMQHELEGNAVEKMRGGKDFGAMTQAIGALEDEGYEVAFIARNIKTGREVSYNAEKDFYSASSIKAPYVTSVYKGLVEPGTVPLEDVSDLTEATIVDSDNDSYSELHEIYGGEPFANWLGEVNIEANGYESLEDFCLRSYPRINTRQLAQMWSHISSYINGTSAPAKQLKEYLTTREIAPLRDALPQNVASLGKAGWMDEEDEEFEASPATNEGGIVFTNKGDVLVVAMSDVPGETERIVPLLHALYQNFDALA